MCLGRESNPYGHFWPRDFKSRVSTYSTTKANGCKDSLIFGKFNQIPTRTRIRNIRSGNYGAMVWTGEARWSHILPAP